MSKNSILVLGKDINHGKKIRGNRLTFQKQNSYQMRPKLVNFRIRVPNNFFFPLNYLYISSLKLSFSFFSGRTNCLIQCQ